jgi:hypothetical protein
VNPAFIMTNNSNSDQVRPARPQQNDQQMQQAVERLILQWRLGRFNTLEDIWLNMQELQFRMGSSNETLRKRLNGAMHEVAQALWNKYQNQ